MSNFDEFISDSTEINKLILKDVPNIKQNIYIDQTCKCEMGHNDIRATIFGCKRCATLYNVSSFKDACNDYIFKIVYGRLENKYLIVKAFNNCNIIINEDKNQHNKILDDIERNQIVFYEVSDAFTMYYITSLIINNKFIDFVPKVYTGFKCSSKCFILEEYIEDMINEDNLLPAIKSVFNILRNLKYMDYNHNNLTYNNVRVTSNGARLINLKYSTIRYKSKKYHLGGFFNNFDNFSASYSKSGKYYIVNENIRDFLKSLIYGGICFYPCVFDFYCFIVSLLLNKKFYKILINNENFMESIYNKMFFPDNYIRLNDSFPLYSNTININNCLDVLEGIKIRYNIFSVIKLE